MIILLQIALILSSANRLLDETRRDERESQLPSHRTLQVCSICLSEETEQSPLLQFGCGQPHLFHRDCRLQWLKTSRACPLCRRALKRNFSSLTFTRRRVRRYVDQRRGLSVLMFDMVFIGCIELHSALHPRTILPSNT